MKPLMRCVVVSLVVLVPASSGAQRLRVAARDSATRTVSIIDFEPCVPAETSNCGAWVDRVVEASAGRAAPMTAAVAALRAFDRDSVWIDDGAVKIRAITPARDRTHTVHDRRGRAVALVASAVPHYAFVLLQSTGDRTQPASTIVLIDLDVCAVIDSFSSPARFSGIAILQ